MRTQWAAILDSAADGIVMIDRSGTVQTFNAAAARIFGYSPAEVVGKNVSMLMPSPHREEHDRYLERYHATGESRVLDTERALEARRKDGTTFPITLRVRKAMLSGVQCYVATIQDVTERRRIESALAESEQRLRLALLASGQATWQSDVRSGRVDFSPEHTAMLGYRPDELHEDRASALARLHPADYQRVLEAYESFLAGSREKFDVECRLGTRAGTWKWVRSTGKVLERDADGHPLRVIGTNADVDDRKRLERSLRRSREDLRRLGQHLESVREEERMRVAREIHDELGQVLTSLGMDLGWIVKRLRPAERALVERVRAMIALVDSAVNSVRRISMELRPSQLDDLGLAAAMEWQLGDIGRRTGLHCTLIDEAAPLTLDAGRSTALFRIFQEALTNVVRHASATRVEVRLATQGDVVVMTIRDDGRGIPKKALSRRDALGVMGMRERALAHGGEVTFRANPGRGTTVTVAMPLDPRRAGRTS